MVRCHVAQLSGRVRPMRMPRTRPGRHARLALCQPTPRNTSQRSENKTKNITFTDGYLTRFICASCTTFWLNRKRFGGDALFWLFQVGSKAFELYAKAQKKRRHSHNRGAQIRLAHKWHVSNFRRPWVSSDTDPVWKPTDWNACDSAHFRVWDFWS